MKVVWKGKTLENMRELFEAAMKVKNKEEAGDFFAAYISAGISPNIARANLGYFAGYYGEKERRFVDEMFGAVHPVFGNNFKTSSEEAYEAGKKFGGTPKERP
jgi:hypothetical protein